MLRVYWTTELSSPADHPRAERQLHLPSDDKWAAEASLRGDDERARALVAAEIEIQEAAKHVKEQRWNVWGRHA